MFLEQQGCEQMDFGAYLRIDDFFGNENIKFRNMNVIPENLGWDY